MNDVSSLVSDAFAQLEIATGIDPDRGADLVLDPSGIEMAIELKRYSLVSGDVVRRILRSRELEQDSFSERAPNRSTLFVVADRVTAEARALLLEAGCGYLDLRGHLAIKGPRLIINAAVDLGWTSPTQVNALAGKAGLEIATTILNEPNQEHPVRKLAQALVRSPSTVSTVLSALRRDRLIDDRGRLVDTRLFWEVAEAWPSRKEYLVKEPPPGQLETITRPLKLGLFDVENTIGWALTDVAAAGAMGAPVAVSHVQAPDFFVPDELVLRRAKTLLGVANGAQPLGCSVRVAPVAAVCRQRLDVPDNYSHWPLVRPVFAALDLAQDAGRGREILADWNPDGPWSRVW